jgi:hypothetical protein
MYYAAGLVGCLAASAVFAVAAGGLAMLLPRIKAMALPEDGGGK